MAPWWVCQTVSGVSSSSPPPQGRCPTGYSHLPPHTHQNCSKWRDLSHTEQCWWSVLWITPDAMKELQARGTFIISLVHVEEELISRVCLVEGFVWCNHVKGLSNVFLIKKDFHSYVFFWKLPFHIWFAALVQSAPQPVIIVHNISVSSSS